MEDANFGRGGVFGVLGLEQRKTEGEEFGDGGLLGRHQMPE